MTRWKRTRRAFAMHPAFAAKSDDSDGLSLVARRWDKAGDLARCVDLSWVGVAHFQIIDFRSKKILEIRANLVGTTQNLRVVRFAKLQWLVIEGVCHRPVAEQRVEIRHCERSM